MIYNLGGNQTANFAATPITTNITLSGQVTAAGNAASGVPVILSGSEGGTATTNSAGIYSFTVPSGGTYTIMALENGYVFSPCSLTRTAVTSSQTANFRRMAPADFNGDGHPDVIWEDPQSGFAQVWYLGGTEGVTVMGAADLTQTNPWHIVAVADFNGDGMPDVVWQDPVSGAVQVWFMGGQAATSW